jgi:DNA helicase IV
MTARKQRLLGDSEVTSPDKRNIQGKSGMTTYETELSDEQKYFDAAWDERERMRENLRSAPGAAAGPRAGAGEVKKAIDARLAAMPGPEEAVAFGRIDFEDDDCLYLGKHAILTEDRDLLVIEWQRPAAEPFYKASVADAMGLRRRRKFDTERNTIRSFEDTVFDALAERIEALTEEEKLGVDDALLRDLDAARDGEMRDIVQTIHESQYDLIRRPLAELLVIQGGPGTGKTAVALHRASWLLFHHREDLGSDDVLVVGPSKTFSRYIEKVLPGLGNQGVTQLDLYSLAPVRSDGRPEPLEVARLKGDGRMAGLLRRALDQRVRWPERAAQLDVGAGARRVTLTRPEVEGELERLRGRGTYNSGRGAMRDWITRTANSRLAGSLVVDAAAVDAALERIWPQLTPAAFVQDLLGSKQRITAAAGDKFYAGDIDRLYRPAADRLANESWSDSDAALLDESDVLINGSVRSFAHVIVDEAQDLSPMQLRSIRRRSARGSYTIVGDIAQSTGPWARASWTDVVDALQQAHQPNLVELRYGYRVPRQVTDLADRLLPHVAPGLEPAVVIRSGPSEPEFASVSGEEMVDASVEAARAYAANGNFVGVICAEDRHESIATALKEAGVTFTDAARGELGRAINLMTAEQAKGLEFDAIVVVEPAGIAGVNHSGLRHLFIALTRTTKHLTVVHSKRFELLGIESGDPGDVDLSLIAEVAHPSDPSQLDAQPLDAAVESPTEGDSAPRRPGSGQGKGNESLRVRTIRATAEFLAEEIRSTLEPDAYGELVEALSDLLEVNDEPWDRDQLF